MDQEQINNIRVLTPEEREELYPVIFEEVFGYAPEKQIPRIVIVYEHENKIKGFISGYRIDQETFYLAWGGVIDTFHSQKKFWAGVEDKLKEAGVKWTQTNIQNINTPVQRLLMGIGWIPFGMRVNGSSLFIQYFKEL